ncbi:glutathione S-transferase family protein [Reinekea marinisedimentorum]|uniref:Glutathione S-transferase n=1 Tax=Reinekea marinisedimentorum TaxID=230495 RepID=A0A4R3I9D6_9GAMM|nr:glutathione S-transferase family protein [Reinekea marinisedimentorum]TCS42998.1 glutathione S-transferase [Reinekea marinisedimentorum]
MKLYRFVNYDRSGRIAWLLMEMGLPYNTESIAYGPEGNFSADYLAKSPVGKIPALDTDDEVLFETGAILLRLAELHPEHDLFPGPDSPQRAHALNWLFLLTASFDPVCFEFVRPDVTDPEEKAVCIHRSERDVVRYLSALDKQLAGKAFILGDQFSIVDIQATCSLMYCQAHGLLEDWPALKSYAMRLAQRPAAVKAETFRVG